MKSTGKWNVLRLASQMVQARNVQILRQTHFINAERSSGAYKPDIAPNYAARAMDIVLSSLQSSKIFSGQELETGAEQVAAGLAR